MDLNKYIVYEIMNLPIDNSVSLMVAIKILESKVKVNLLMDKDYRPYYSVNIDEILKTDITPENLIEIRNNGWCLSEDKEYIVKFLN